MFIWVKTVVHISCGCTQFQTWPFSFCLITVLLVLGLKQLQAYLACHYERKMHLLQEYIYYLLHALVCWFHAASSPSPSTFSQHSAKPCLATFVWASFMDSTVLDNLRHSWCIFDGDQVSCVKFRWRLSRLGCIDGGGIRKNVIFTRICGTVQCTY